jgi:uncharacterized membrane protein
MDPSHFVVTGLASELYYTLQAMEATPSLRLPGSVFVALIVYGVLQGNYYASRLPDILATHFGGRGQPNGWQTHSAFWATETFVVSIATLIGFGVPAMLKSIPVSLINVPNKEHWFAPERRESTLAYFRATFAWFGCGLLAFLLFVNELVFRANLKTPHQLNTTAFVAALFVFMAFTALWTIRLILRFSKSSR